MANDLTRAEKADSYDDAINRLRSFRRRVEEESEGFMLNVTSHAAAGAFGFARGYMGADRFTVLGIEADAVLGVGFHAVGLWQGGSMGKQLGAIGNGGTIPWTARFAERWAAAYKSGAKTSGESLMFPMAGASHSSSINPEALSALQKIATNFQPPPGAR